MNCCRDKPWSVNYLASRRSLPRCSSSSFCGLEPGPPLAVVKVVHCTTSRQGILGQRTDAHKEGMVYQNDCASFQTHEQCPVSTHPCQSLSHLSLLFRWVGNGFHHYDLWPTGDTGILSSVICLGHELLWEERLCLTITPMLESNPKQWS